MNDRRHWRICKMVACAVLCAISLDIAAAQNLDDGWRNLEHFTHSRNYLVIQKDGSCLHGEIRRVRDDDLQFRVQNAAPGNVERTIHRGDVDRITDDTLPLIHNVAFSARSSWNDLKTADPMGRLEGLLIVTTGGRRYKTHQFVMDDQSITLNDDGQKLTLSKADVQRGYYIRVNPLSSSEEYTLQEAPYLDPRTWFGPLFVRTTPVLLYDASAVQDDSLLKCSVK